MSEPTPQLSMEDLEAAMSGATPNPDRAAAPQNTSEQPAEPSPIESLEATQATELSPEEQEAQQLAAEARQSVVRQEVTHLDNSGSLLILIDRVRSGLAGSELDSAIAELAGNDPEKAKNWHEAAKFISKSAEMGIDQLPTEHQEQVLAGFAEILVEGHINAETLILSVGKVEFIADPNTDTRTKNCQDYCGYPGVVFRVDEGILLTPAAFEKDANGRPKVDVKHILKHEIGHDVVDSGAAFATQKENLRKHIAPKEGEAQEELDETSKIILKFAEEAPLETLPAGLQLIVEPYRHLQETGVAQGYLDRFNEGRRQTGKPEASLESYMQSRRLTVVNEVTTEISACYLESNGQFEDFARIIISRSNSDKLAKYFREDQPQGIQSYNLESIKTGATQRENLPQVFERYSNNSERFREYLADYKTLFDNLHLAMSNKDEFNAKIARLYTEDEAEDEETDTEGILDDGVYSDPAMPTSEQPGQGNSEAIGAGMLQAVSAELDIAAETLK